MNCTLMDSNVCLLELNCRRRMAETKGTGGCPWDGKVRRMDPPSSCLSISGISVCAIRLGLRRPEDGRPLDGCPRDGCPWDGCSRDGCSWEGCPRDGWCVVVLFSPLLKALVDHAVWLSLMRARVGGWVGGWVVGRVVVCVWRSAWQKEHVLWWDLVLIIVLYQVCLWSYYKL